MADDNSDEVLGKADALLSRYRSGEGHRQASQDDFPVLTEIVKVDTASQPALAHAEDDSGIRDPEQAEHLVQDGQALEEELLARVINAIEPRLQDILGPSLEANINSRLDPIVTGLSGQLAAAIRDDIQGALKAAIAEAVRHELSLLDKTSS